MGKNILILNGSPRPKGNTAMLIDAFTKGAEQSGNQVTTFFLDGMNIHGCKGCYRGGQDPASPCVQKDDMDKIYPVFTEADVVVMASPLYFWMWSGQLRTAFDRLFAAMEGKGYQNLQKDCVLLMAAQGDEYDEALTYYKGLAAHMQWNDLGAVLASGVTNVGDIAGKPELEQARALGASIR